MTPHAIANSLPLRRPAASDLSGMFVTLVLLACMMIPVALSIFFFMGQSLRLDEAQSLWQTSRNFGDIFTIVASDVHVPLYHLLLHMWQLFVGQGVIGARALSLFFYVLSIPMLYVLGARAFNRRVGLFAAFLFAISPFMNWYGNEIRMYTLFTFFVILNQYFFIRLWQSNGTNDHVWAGYSITALLGVFSHYFFFLNLASQIVFYILRRDLFVRGTFKRFVFSGVLIIGSFSPWVWYVYRLGSAGFQEPVLAIPTSVNLFSTFSQFLFGFQNDNINTFFLSLWPVTVIFGLFTLQRDQRLSPETEYLVTTILVSFAIAFIGSFLVAPVFVSRYLIFTVPSLYLLLGSIFDHYSPRFARFARLSLVGLMVITLCIEILNPTTPTKENYFTATTYLNEHATAQDVIILSAPFTIYPVQYYYRGPSPLSTLPFWNQYAYGPIPPFKAQELPTQVEHITGSSQNVYLLLSYDQGYEKIIKDYFESHYRRLSEQIFSNDLTLYVYQLRYDTSRSAIGTN